MRTTVAIVADDLTGALDTGTPFVEAGLSVIVALDIEGLETALKDGADVVVVNTASRGLTEAEAARRVAYVANLLREAAPSFILKKVDSRLKGNVRAECAAMAWALARNTLVVAPAIPDQERHTVDGHVVGRGVAEPLSIAAVFAGSDLALHVADGRSDADMDRIVKAIDWASSLVVGARGIGSALARSLAPARPLQAFRLSEKTVLAFGSRDPITSGQMDILEQSGQLAAIIEAPVGVLAIEGDSPDLPLLLRCSGDMAEDMAVVAKRFAEGVAEVVSKARPDVLMMGGGDTALAILRKLGIQTLKPRGEVEPGIPWFEISAGNERQIRCAVKSGGFGNPYSLLSVLNTAPKYCTENAAGRLMGKW